MHIIKTKSCISSLRKVIQPTADDIHATRDDIPLLSQWIKKFDKPKLVEFFGTPKGIRTPGLSVRSRTLYPLSYGRKSMDALLSKFTMYIILKIWDFVKWFLSKT